MLQIFMYKTFLILPHLLILNKPDSLLYSIQYQAPSGSGHPIHGMRDPKVTNNHQSHSDHTQRARTRHIRIQYSRCSGGATPLPPHHGNITLSCFCCRSFLLECSVVSAISPGFTVIKRPFTVRAMLKFFNIRATQSEGYATGRGQLEMFKTKSSNGNGKQTDHIMFHRSTMMSLNISCMPRSGSTICLS